MKSPHKRLHGAIHVRERGIALVIVLAMLVLMSVVLVGFMTTATTELSATQAASSSTVARQLADTTINLVIGQLREATTQPDEKTNWVSQPGAIRTYSGQSNSSRKQLNSAGSFYYDYSPGSQDFVYKLYSSDNMKVRSGEYSSTELPQEVAIIENWATDKPEGYVDLNEPLLRPLYDEDPSGKVVEPRYPVIDPRAMFNANGGLTTSPSNPSLVEGFDAKLDFPDDRILAGSNEKVPHLPMPVKWLYVLQDGSVGPAELAEKNNPMIGRIAFWVDDETCKLNINTASEGTFWDTPHASTSQESGMVDSSSKRLTSESLDRFSLNLAAASPVAGEYQRYPGHPMTTSLSPVFGWMWGLKPNMSLYPMHNRDYTAFKEAIYKISPFTPAGQFTTFGATVNAEPFMPNIDGEKLKHSVATKHLYATVDELLFTSDRNSGGTNATSELNNFGNQFTPEALEKTRFFLSANSRAPELNLYGRPRVTIWPVNEDPKNRTQFDDLFAFTSTIAKTATESTDKRYYLNRKDAKSDTADFNAQNKAMYEYLQNMTSRPVPGFGNSLLSKYDSSVERRDQILTQIFDYVRTVNLIDTGTSSKSLNAFYPYTPRFYPENVDQTYSRRSRAIDWSGQVTPLKVGSTMGMGRFFTISEAALVFHKLSTTAAPGTAADRLQATLALELSTTMPGYPAIKETYWTRVTGDPGKKLEIALGNNGSFEDVEFCTQVLNNQSGLVNVVNVASHEVTFGRGFMPTLGFTAAMHWHQPHRGYTYPERYRFPERDDPAFLQTGSANPGVKTFIWQNPSGTLPAEKYNIGLSNYNVRETLKNYPYVSKPLPIPVASANNPRPTTFKFRGPALKVEIWVGQGPEDPRSRLVQTVNLDFPNSVGNLPMPTSGPFNAYGVTRFDGSLDGRWRESITGTTSSGDVVRSVQFTGPAGAPLESRGDLRLGAALQNVPKDYYTPRDGYLTADWKAHGLTSSHADPVDGHSGNHGKLVANSSIRSSKPPILPEKVNGVSRMVPNRGPGDWDRGISKHMDGAFGNKVDEGNLKFDQGVTGATDSSKLPYYRGRGIEETGQSFFTPNRQLPSPVMLGSLPSGINPVAPNASKPWQTLLFRPDRESSGPGHPGAQSGASPAEHLWLDLFHVPVVEPYAISEPFSTAGKVNMNYVIAPFGYAKGGPGGNTGMQSQRSYLRRDTALRGVLRSTWMMMVPNNATEMGHTEKVEVGKYYRFPIDLDRTIDNMELRLNDQRQSPDSRSTTLFRSASEICDIDLYPKSVPGTPPAPGISNWAAHWNNYYATGDNMRERPYAHIYPRLTTKSNSYTVHMRCQAIRKAPGTDPKEFNQKRDVVASEYRASSVIERFIDPNDPALEDYDHIKEKVDPYYRFRVVSTKHFVGD